MVKKHVLHLIYDDLNNPWLGGGGAVRTWEVYRRFGPDWCITVATGNYPGAQSFQKGNVRYVRLGSAPNYPISRLSYTLMGRKRARLEDYDLLVEDFSPYSPCLAARYTSKPAVAIIQNIFGAHAVRHLGPLGIIALVAEKKMFKLYKNFITVSQTITDRTVAMASRGAQVVFLAHGVDEDLFEHYDIAEEPFILFIGRIDIYQKGLDVLLAAFAELTKKHPKLELWIVGTGKDETRLRNIIKANAGIAARVKLLGRIVGLKKRDLIRRSLLVCIPSRFESWGLVAVEANACAKPVVGSSIPGLNEALRDGETALLVPPEDPTCLASALDRVVSDAALRKRLGQNGREWASRFTWQKTASEQEKLFLQLIEGHA